VVQVGSAKVCAAQISPYQVGRREIRIPDIGLAQIGKSEIRELKRGEPQVSKTQVGTREIGISPKVGTPQKGALKVGIR
jgi:hypothetical protein